ncbi:MAG: di-heme oxidoredictase family protein [Rhizobiaceae bacterium]
MAAVVCGGLAFAQEPPWSERALRAHVDQNDLRGTLPKMVLEELRRQGETLFDARFTPADGAGRPRATMAPAPTRREKASQTLFNRATGPDANACSGCHNQPAAGGAGDFASNIFIVENPEGDLAPMPDPSLANERGTSHIFGAGLIELLAREMTADLQAARSRAAAKAERQGRAVTLRLAAKGVDFGEIIVAPDGTTDTTRLDGVDADLVVRPFGQKGVFVSLREFTVTVLNHHLGMQADERFGLAHTGELDFDGDGVSVEMTEGDVSALVAWQAGLAPPTTIAPDDARWREAAARGRAVFGELGCAACHVPSLPLESLRFSDPGPVDAAGTLTAADVMEPAVYDLDLADWAAALPRDEDGRVLVPLFGDLKRHAIAGDGEPLGNERLSQRGVPTGSFMTAELWGLASTAPYGHRNDHVTIDGIIRAHGGEARDARSGYERADEADRSALIAFLKTLVIEP